MLLKNRTETRQMDDNASQSSSSTSSLKAATSFVSSLSTKSWAVLSRKMKSATISKEGVSDKCDDITHAATTGASSNDHTISKNGSLKKTSSYGTSFNNNSASSSMDCSPQHQMVYKEIIIPNNNNNGYYDTASSVTLASSSSLTTASSGNLMDSSNTLPSRMEVEEKIPSQKTESGFHSSTNSQSTSVSSKDVSSSKSSDTKTSTASSTSSTASSQGDVNGRVESLVNKVLSPEAITVINLISTKFDALSRTNTIEGALSQDINNTSYNKTLMFSGRKEPSVTLNAFLLRLVTLLNWVFDKNSENGKGLNSTGMRYLVISTLYIERAMNMHPDLKITPLNIHRIFLGATVNAMTFFEDQIPDKTIMAKIGGVDEKQVRILGKRFFQFLDYRLWIEPSDYILYYKRICETVQISFEPEIPSWQL